MGLPVVSVDVDGAKELVELANCGMVVANSEQGITESLIGMAENYDVVGWKKTAMTSRSLFFKQPRIEKIEKTLDSVLILDKGNE